MISKRQNDKAMGLKIPRKPICTVTHGPHGHHFGVAPIPGIGSPDVGAAFVVVFEETIRNGKLVWKKMGEARFDSHRGLCGTSTR